MSKSNQFETSLLKLVFQNTTIPIIGDATGILGSAASGVLWVSLHTADPGEGGSQLTNEATYTGYDRMSVVRGTAGWTVSGSAVTNAGTITFPTCTGGSETITHAAVGASGLPASGLLIYSGALNSSLAVSNNITPVISVGNFTVTED